VSTRALVAVLIVVVVVLAAAFFLMPKGEEVEKPKGIVLKVITRHASTIQLLTKEKFLSTDLAKRYNITDIQFFSPHPALWRDTITKQECDVAWGGGPALFNELIRMGLVAPITDPDTLAIVDELPDEIGGAEMKHYEGGQLMWVASAISSFGFSINYPILEQYGLPEPELWEDLASPYLGHIWTG